MNSANICRKNGWNVGDILEGDEGYGPSRILITAIGEEKILARQILHNNKPTFGYTEGLWTLEYRDWKKVDSGVIK